jgi:very-short-patch-repair endonuclease
MNKKELKELLKQKCITKDGKYNTNCKKMFKGKLKNIKELVEKETEFLNNDYSLMERIYCIINNINLLEQLPKCIICGEHTHILLYKDGFRKYCSNKICGNKYTDLQVSKSLKGKKRNFYAFERRKIVGYNPLNLEELKETIKNTCFNKNGYAASYKIFNEKVLLDKINEYTKFLDFKKPKLIEKLYCILNDIDCLEKIPKCNWCKNYSKFNCFKTGYQQYCCRKCQEKYRTDKAHKSAKLTGDELKESIIKNLVSYCKERKYFRKEKRVFNSCRPELNVLYDSQTGRKINEESRNKLRIARANFIENNCGGPAHNKTSILFFNLINEKFNFNGRYARNGGEKNILGYFLDFYDEENKIIIEWDEEFHYKKNQLKECDINRQKRIMNKLLDFKFIRIREKEFLNLTLENKFNYINIKINNY